MLPPASSSFLPYNFALSPDGRQLAFVGLGPDGKTTLWVRALSGSVAQQLNGTEGASYPFWSADSRQIGFFADRRLKTVDVASSAMRNQMYRAFPEKPYRQRARIETIFSVVKRKLSSRAPGRSLATQIRQALLLGLTCNLYRLRHRHVLEDVNRAINTYEN